MRHLLLQLPGQVPIVQYIRKTKTHINNVKRAQQAALAASRKDTPPTPAPVPGNASVSDAKSISVAKEMSQPAETPAKKEEESK